MPRFLAAIGSGVGLAVIAGFFFWWANGFHRVNGVGLLRRQEWPVSDLWFWIAAGFVLGLIAGWVHATRRADHARKAREVAEENGLGFADEFQLPSGALAMPVLAGFSDGRNAMSGSAVDVPVAVFDFTTVTRGESRSDTDRTVAFLPAPGLPAFDLRPRNFGRRLVSWVGYEGVTFDAAAVSPADVDTVRRFTQLFHLSATDPMAVIGGLAVGGRPDEDGSIRRLFTPAIMGACCEHPGYAVQSHGGHLAVWRGSGILNARRRPALWDAAVELRAAFLRPDAGAGEAVVPARPGMDMDRQAIKVRNAILGGVAGLFAGFILSAMLLSILFFRNPPGEGPRFGFFGFPLVFFGCVVAGAAAGSFVGSRLPIRDVPPGPPEDANRLKGRQRLTKWGGIAGLVVGFYGGGVLFGVSKFLFDWKFDNFGIDAAIFFGSIFGCAVVGAILGGAGMNRIARWRGRERRRDDQSTASPDQSTASPDQSTASPVA